VHPAGKAEVTVLVLGPDAVGQADQSEYVNEVQVTGGYVQDVVSVAGCVTPPEQVPSLVQVLVCCPDDGQTVGDKVNVQSLSAQGGTGTYVHVCEVTGIAPPEHPCGEDAVTVLV